MLWTRCDYGGRWKVDGSFGTHLGVTRRGTGIELDEGKGGVMDDSQVSGMGKE
jgi:hypothetical protein